MTGKPLGSMGTPSAAWSPAESSSSAATAARFKLKQEPAKYLAKLPRPPKPMIDAIITFSIRNRALVSAPSLALAVLGAWAAWETPVDAIPDLSENQVIVFTDGKGTARARSRTR